MNNQNNLKKELRELREEIDKIDDTIVELLNKRGNIVAAIGDLKDRLDMKVFQPQREKEIIERLKNKSSIFRDSSIEAIWKEIMSASKLIQGSITKVGYLGPKGTFTHQAALEYFPKAGSEFITASSSLEIFENVEKGLIDFGVIPIENSLHGTVREIRLQPQTIQNVVNYTVVVDAANVNGLLLPGMTATIDFVVEQREDVLLISNTALRFQPNQEMLAELRNTMMEKIADLPDSVKQLRKQEMDMRMQHTGFPGMGAQNESQLPDDVALLWYFDDKNKLSIMPARTGATDGQKTEIVQGHNIREGMEFISSIEKDGKSKSSSRNDQAMPHRPPIF